MLIAIEAASLIGAMPIQFYSLRLNHGKMYLQADFTEEAREIIKQAFPKANWHYEDNHRWWQVAAEITTRQGIVACEITLCL